MPEETLYEAASRFTVLKRTGKQFKGLSPFTLERKPSFFINPSKGDLWICFSSGFSGKGVASFLSKGPQKRDAATDAARKAALPPVDNEIPF